MAQDTITDNLCRRSPVELFEDTQGLIYSGMVRHTDAEMTVRKKFILTVRKKQETEHPTARSTGVSQKVKRTRKLVG